MDFNNNNHRQINHQQRDDDHRHEEEKEIKVENGIEDDEVEIEILPEPELTIQPNLKLENEPKLEPKLELERVPNLIPAVEVKFHSPSVDITLIDSETEEEYSRELSRRSQLGHQLDIEKELELGSDILENSQTQNAETSHSEKDSSILEILHVDDSQSLEEDSLDSAPTLASLSNFNDSTFLKISPFSERYKMRLLRNMLKLSTEEFIRIYVHQRKLPVLNLISLLDARIPQAFLRYKEADLIPFLRALINQSTRSRPKLFAYNTIEDCVKLIQRSNKILVVTGAGVSVSCGIPDFRSENGIYSRLKEFDLDDPQQMFCLEHFREDPNCFYSFAKEIYPSNFKPSSSHQFIKLLEDQGKLLRNYTQNIDTLENIAGIKNVIQCHGSFATASCIRCRHSYPGTHIKKDIFKQRVPLCSFCDHLDLDDDYINIPAIIKPDIVFFGEGLPKEYDTSLSKDYSEVDLLIVMGTSLKVRPVSEIPTFLPPQIPSIIINRTPNTSIDFDIQLLGYSDSVVTEICHRLGWALPTHDFVPKPQSNSTDDWSSFHKPSHWHLFSGAQLTEVMTINSSSDSGSSENEADADDSHSPHDILLPVSPVPDPPSLHPLLPTPPTISSHGSFDDVPPRQPRRSIQDTTPGKGPLPLSRNQLHSIQEVPHSDDPLVSPRKYPIPTELDTGSNPSSRKRRPSTHATELDVDSIPSSLRKRRLSVQATEMDVDSIPSSLRKRRPSAQATELDRGSVPSPRLHRSNLPPNNFDESPTIPFKKPSSRNLRISKLDEDYILSPRKFRPDDSVQELDVDSVSPPRNPSMKLLDTDDGNPFLSPQPQPRNVPAPERDKHLSSMPRIRRPSIPTSQLGRDPSLRKLRHNVRVPELGRDAITLPPRYPRDSKVFKPDCDPTSVPRIPRPKPPVSEFQEDAIPSPRKYRPNGPGSRLDVDTVISPRKPSRSSQVTGLNVDSVTAPRKPFRSSQAPELDVDSVVSPRKTPRKSQVPELNVDSIESSRKTPRKLQAQELDVDTVESSRKAPRKVQIPELDFDTAECSRKTPRKLQVQELDVDSVETSRKTPRKLQIPELDVDSVESSHKTPRKLQAQELDVDSVETSRKTPRKPQATELDVDSVVPSRKPPRSSQILELDVDSVVSPQKYPRKLQVSELAKEFTSSPRKFRPKLEYSKLDGDNPSLLKYQSNLQDFGLDKDSVVSSRNPRSLQVPKLDRDTLVSPRTHPRDLQTSKLDRDLIPPPRSHRQDAQASTSTESTGSLTRKFPRSLPVMERNERSPLLPRNPIRHLQDSERGRESTILRKRPLVNQDSRLDRNSASVPRKRLRDIQSSEVDQDAAASLRKHRYSLQATTPDENTDSLPRKHPRNLQLSERSEGSSALPRNHRPALHAPASSDPAPLPQKHLRHPRTSERDSELPRLSRKRKVSAPPYHYASNSLLPRTKPRREVASSPDGFVDVDSSPSYQPSHD